MSVRVSPQRWLLAAVVTLIVVQLTVRGLLAFRGYFYWDDLIMIGRAGTHDLLSTGYLFDDHDGHVMPAAFLVAGAIARIWPLQWAPAAISLVVLQLIATLALTRALRVILGWRPVLLVPLTFALFCPIGLPAFAWWAAALNYLPMTAALAWVCTDAILLTRTGIHRYAVTGTLAYATGLLFFEKSAAIPFAAFVLAALLRYVQTDSSARQAFTAVWRDGRRLWLPALAITTGWVALYLRVVNQHRWSLDLPMTRDLLWRSITHGIVPGLVGGPWHWARWAPASPWATPGPVVMTLGWLTLAALLVASVLRRRRIGAVWLVATGYAIVCQVPIYLMRSSAFTVLELAQTLRYLADFVVVAALLAAIGYVAAVRSPTIDRPGHMSAARAGAAMVAVAFVIGSAYSTATFDTVWRQNPAEPYLKNARRDLAAARAESAAPLLDQEVDPMVLQRVVGPDSRASHLFALLPERPEFATATTRPRLLDSSGHLLDAQVTWARAIVPGPVDDCGYLVQQEHPARMTLDGGLLPADWTAEINYLANVDGTLTMSLDDGPPARVPVRPGLNRVYVRLPGAGDVITARAETAALSVCIAAGPVGQLAPR